jgi:hypothetical protein
MTIVIAILLVAGAAFRFHSRFNAEVHRQRMLTWPEVPAIFDPNEPILLEPHIGSASKEWFTRLLKPYRFYYNGELREGNHLIPDNIKLREYDQRAVARKLNWRREQMTVRCNSEVPEDNTLLVPHQGLTWSRLLVYLFFGVVLPVLFLYGVLAYHWEPNYWLELGMDYGSSILLFALIILYVSLRSEHRVQDLIPE